MSKSLKQSKDVFEWLGALDPALLELVQESANSKGQPTPPLVLAARATVSIVNAIQDAEGVAPEVQLLVEHAVRVVGLLCRAYRKDADVQNWHTEVGQILVNLLILLPEVLHHVKRTPFFDGARTRVYAEELQIATAKVDSLLTRQEICTRRPRTAPHEEEWERHQAEDKVSETENEEQDYVLAGCKVKGEACQTARGTRFVPERYGMEIDPLNSHFALYPSNVHHPGVAFPYSSGYSSPLSPYAASHVFFPVPMGFPSFSTPGETFFVPCYPLPPLLSNQSARNVQNILITNNMQYLGIGRSMLRYVPSWKRRKLTTHDHLDLLQAVSQSAPPPFLKVVRDVALKIARHGSTGVASVLADEAIMTAAILWTSYTQAPDPFIWERATEELVEKVASMLCGILGSMLYQAASSVVSSLLHWDFRRRKMEAYRAELQLTLIEIALWDLDLHEMSSWPLEEQEDVISQLDARGRPHVVEEGEDDVEAADMKMTELEDQSTDGACRAYQGSERIPTQQKGKGRQQVNIDSSTATAPEHQSVSIYADFSGSTDVVNAGDSGQGSSTSSSYPHYLGPCLPYPYQYPPGTSSYGGPSFYSEPPSPHYPSSLPSGIYASALSPTMTSTQNSESLPSTGSANVDNEYSVRRRGRRPKKSKDST